MVMIGGHVSQQRSNLVCGWRHFFSDVDHSRFAEAQVTAGPDNYNLRLLSQTKLTSSSVGAIITDINNKGDTLTLHLWETLSKRLIGDAQFAVGQSNSIRFGITRRAKTTTMSSHIRLSDVDYYLNEWPFSLPSLEANYSKKLSKYETLSLETEIGLESLPSLGAGYMRRICKGNKLGFQTAIAANGACTINLTYNYYGQQLALPIVATRGLEGWTSLGAFMLPMLGVLAAAHFWFNPLRERRKKQKKAARQRLRHEQIMLKKKQAEMDIRLILPHAMRKVEAERARQGLVIVLGQYGSWKGESEEEAEEGSVIDVTVPLQYKVEDSQLILEEGPKSSLYGFFDPCPGQEKQLRVRYLFKDKIHQAVVNDNDELKIPLQEHLLRETLSEGRGGLV